MEQGDLPPALYAAALHAAAWLSRTHDDPARAILLAEAALARFRGIDDAWHIASLIHLLGVLERSQGNFERAAPLHEEAAMRFRELDEPFSIALSKCNLGMLAHWQGDDRRATALLEQAVDAFCALDDPWGLGLALSIWALVVGDCGDHDRAADLHREALDRLREVGSKEILIDAVARIATLAVVTGRPAEGARLLGAVEAASLALGYSIERPEQSRYARAVDDARIILGDDALEAAWSAGRAMTLDLAVAEGRRLVSEPAGGTPSGLTPREGEVLRLLAAGQSNREIGERLFISPATVARHLANVYAKLDVDSRAKAVAYAHRQGLN
jgi:ATP/maltotriose-dependent transcriptional regulator MalT